MASGDAQQAPQKDAARPHKSPKPKINPSTANIRKRQPRRLPKRKNDIYVTRKSNFASQMEQCEKLFDGGEKEVCIHSLGAAINRALNIALQLESRSLGTLQVAISTSTVRSAVDGSIGTPVAMKGTLIRGREATLLYISECLGLRARKRMCQISDVDLTCINGNSHISEGHRNFVRSWIIIYSLISLVKSKFVAVSI
eukprot:XP_011676766.1 PREDICTED: uncharacterized protein LOC584273 isoform X1 [Strongylocentrotus purpuratus]